MPQVQRIDPIVLPSEKETVAAYCRVSTNSEDQANSYNTQIAYYTKRISENPDWELVDIYADRGISGTSMAKRDEFNRMLADCRVGKIKRVLVKSVSRFARNTTELLQTTRELKDLGVVVVFEEQGYAGLCELLQVRRVHHAGARRPVYGRLLRLHGGWQRFCPYHERKSSGNRVWRDVNVQSKINQSYRGIYHG